MKQTYEYMHVTTAMDSISIEDIGNCALEEFNDDGKQWFLFISTNLGRTVIIEFGPFDSGNLDDFNFYFNRRNIEYKESYIDKTIKKFVENPTRMITQVSIIDTNKIIEALDVVKEQLDY